jgi:23S rRNA (cytosine1962-C5)-methyltransferase
MAGAVDHVDGKPAAGDVVQIVDDRGRFIDLALYNPKSAIRARLLGVQTESHPGIVDGRLTLDFVRERLERALDRRRAIGLPSADTTAFRVANSEGDGLPGVVIDALADAVVIQLSTAAALELASLIRDAVAAVMRPAQIVIRTDERMAKLENIEPYAEQIGEAREVEIVERGIRYRVFPGGAQKTGFYVDQRDNRARFGQRAAGRRVLDAHCYLGGFALHAARNGAAEVVGIDSSAEAVAGATLAASLNGLTNVRFERAKVEAYLSSAADRGERFDLISLDPPRLAPDRAARDAALAKIEQLVGQAIRVLEPGGVVLLSSCSHAIGEAEQLQAIGAAGARARRIPRVLEIHTQPGDHPWPAAMPEGRYLSAVFAQFD